MVRTIMFAWSCRKKSIIINAVILAAFLLCIHTVYETNDDHTIAKMIVGGYANMGFVNCYLCKALIAIQKLLPGINVFILSQIFLSFVSFVVILRIIFERSKNKITDVIAILVIAVFAIDHYAIIQFTKTSALLITAGLISILDTAQNSKRKANYIEGGLLIILGTTFRWNTLLPSLGYLCAYLGVFVLILLISGIKERNLKETTSSLKIFIPCVIVLIITIGLSFSLDKASSAMNRSTEELQATREYSSLRARMTDFPVDDLYDNYTKECDAIGIDDNDILLIHKWVLDYDGAATVDNLKVLSEIGKDASGNRLTVTRVVKKCGRGIIKSLKKMDYTGWHIAILILLSLFIIVTTKPRNWLYVIGFGGLTICLYLVLYYMQRPVYRTLYIADIGAAMWLLYIAASNSNKIKNYSKAVAALVIVACCLALPMEAQRVERRYASTAHRTRPAELDEYFEAHNDSLFVCEVNGWNNAKTYETPLKVSTNAQSNDVSVGGWSTLSPYQIEHLNKYGINNPIKDLIDNEHAFYVGNARIKEMKEYYNKWYSDKGNNIKFILVDTVGGKNIWKVARADNN